MTLGMMFAAAALVYVVLTIGVMVILGVASKQMGKSSLYGVSVGFVGMVSLVFWDAIPTYVALSRYCDMHYGFRVFKTLDQWKLENPGVAETLRPNTETHIESLENVQTMHLNQRFDWERRIDPMFLSVRRSTTQVIDSTTKQVLADLVDFRSGSGPIGLGGSGWTAVKVWLYRPGCYPAGTKSDGKDFNRFQGEIMIIGERI